MRRAGLVGIVSLLACAPKDQPPPPQHPQVVRVVSADRLLAQRRFREALLAYQGELRQATEPNDVARLRFLIATARLGVAERDQRQRVFEDLRFVEHEYPDSIWARLSRLLLDEMTRQEALREALLDTGAQVDRLESAIAALEESAVTQRDEASKLKGANATLKDERNTLKQELAEANARLVELQTAQKDLEEKLEALKRIDLQQGS